MSDFATALQALAPIIVVGLAILGLATLLVNGGIGWMILVDQIHLRRRARATGCTIAELMDADERAKHTGYLEETTETWWPFPAPEFIGSESPDFTEWEREVAG